MTGPYCWLSTPWQIALCAAMAAISLALGLYLGKQGAPLQDKLSNGVLDLETPWTSKSAEGMLGALGPDGIRLARKQILLDYALLLVYPVVLSLICALLAGITDGKLGLLGLMVAWAVMLAGPLDAIENFAVLKLLSGMTAAPWPQVATICAAIKFALIFGGIGFIACGTPGAILSWLRST